MEAGSLDAFKRELDRALKDSGVRTRGHHLRIRGKPFRMEMRKYFFSQRVVSVEFSASEGGGGRFSGSFQERAR